MLGFRAVSNFNKVNIDERQYIPDPDKERISTGRRNVRRIRNDMDESEAGGPTRQCIVCEQYGHRDNYCPTRGLGRGRGNRGRRGRRGGGNAI